MKSIFTFFLFFPAWLLISQTKSGLIPRELFFKEKEKTNIQLSKDGETVLYKKSGEKNKNILFYINTNTPRVEHKKILDGNLLKYKTVYDDGLVAVIKKDSTLQVQLIKIKSKKKRRLDIFPFNSLGFVSLSARFPNKILIDIDAKETKKSGLYLLDLLNSNLKRLGNMGGYDQLFFDQNFSKIAALKRNEQGGNTIFRFYNGVWELVTRYPFDPEMFIGGLSKIVSVSADGKTIYATDNFAKDKTSLVSISVATGKVTELLSDPDADILPFVPTLDPQGKPLAVVSRWGGIRRHFLDEGAKKDFEFLEKEMDGSVSFVEASEDGQCWLLRALNGGPTAYYHFDRPAQKLTKLFNDYPYLNDHDLATRKTHTVTVRDGMKFPVNVYVPYGMSKADGIPRVPLPTIVYVHGGPWAGLKYWDSWFLTRNLQLLADRGYAVVQVEFRGTNGLGKKVCDAGDKQWGAAMHHDIVDITNWAVTAGIANPKRLGIWGWSYGGYAVNYALAAAPDLFACGISMAGVSDLYGFAQGRSGRWRALVGDPDTEEGAALLKAHSPSTYIDNIKAPLLLVNGGLDNRVPPKQSADFAEALNKKGNEVVYFYYPDEPHSLLKPESWISFWAIAEGFLHKYLGGKKEPQNGDVKKGDLRGVYE
ncbi:MAG TPA: S9 family peptidase [Bacteroidetes bacterium]|nr:S9 family peptidase [Bacteroidota bacterium]